MTLYIDTRPTLEWVWNATKKRHEAKTPFGTYTIDEGVGGFIIYFEDVWCIERDYSHDAMAAAQADYDLRTAERFRAIDIRILLDSCGRYELDYLDDAIAKATLPESLHTKP
jgi:hypothetical protein